MPIRRMVLEIGHGTALRSADYTKAAVRAVENAIWRNSVTVADAFGVGRDDMLVEAHIGAQHPDQVDVDTVAAAFPYGRVTVIPEFGGMDIPKDTGGVTVFVNAAVIVSLDLPEAADA